MAQHDPVGMSEQYEVLAVRYGTRQASAMVKDMRIARWLDPERFPAD